MAAGGRRTLLLIWALGLVCQALLISDKLDVTPARGLVFNEMLVRLLHGHFDLNPATIGDEAILSHGRTYAYFGVFCALLRLPLVLIGQTGLDITKSSILLASAISLAARLAAVDLALGQAKGVTRPLRLVVLAGVAFGGESLQYLRPSMYQEVCTWGSALAAVFVWLLARRLWDRQSGPQRLYPAMAMMAGSALLCRVSFGLGLYGALGLVLLVEAWRARRRLIALKLLAPAAMILTLFAGAAMGINAARWDAPLTFVPFSQQLALVRYGDDRLQRLERTGMLDPQRIPFALQYYFAPVWMLQDGRGRLLFQKTQLDLFDCVELPPSSLLLSDPVICLLAALGLAALARRRFDPQAAPLAGAALAGLACPLAVILSAISLSFRYRLDFYPALDFAAVLGAASLRLNPMRPPIPRFVALGAAGAAVAVAGLWANYNSPQGSALDLDLRCGWTTPIRDVAAGRDPHIGHLLANGRRTPRLR